MARAKKQVEPDEASGAPEWMVTFSDCMTLLLTFFVLLLSFSSFDDKTFRQFQDTLFADLPTIYRQAKKEEEALLSMEKTQYTKDIDQGSEKPTLAKDSKGLLREEKESVDFHDRKVFLISSARIFWAKGTTISSKGSDALETVGAFLKRLSDNRIVISENGRQDDEASRELGLLRAWEVMEYLTTKRGFDKGWFSISASSTMAENSFKITELNRPGADVERVLEIVLLEGSIYN